MKRLFLALLVGVLLAALAMPAAARAQPKPKFGDLATAARAAAAVQCVTSTRSASGVGQLDRIVSCPPRGA